VSFGAIGARTAKIGQIHGRGRTKSGQDFSSPIDPRLTGLVAPRCLQDFIVPSHRRTPALRSRVYVLLHHPDGVCVPEWKLGAKPTPASANPVANVWREIVPVATVGSGKWMFCSNWSSGSHSLMCFPSAHCTITTFDFRVDEAETAGLALILCCWMAYTLTGGV